MAIRNLEKLKDYVETKVPKLMAQARIPGLSLAIVKDDEIVYAEGFGSRKLEGRIPATPHTLYGIGSCSKSFAALAVMQLVEKGKISVDDPVNKYAPLKIGISGKPIRIHHLLSHSSGIAPLGTSTILRSRLPIPMSSFEDHYRFLNGAQGEIVAEPGKKFAYLNAGYCTLQDIVERVSKTSFDEYVRENIFKPLKMKRSTYSKEEFEKDPDRMTSYIRDREGKPTPAKPVIHKLLYARGGILSSVTELSNYLTANINKGKFQDVELVSPDLIEEMHKIQIETSPGQGYGYGWRVVEDFLGSKLVSHGGSIRVSGAHLAFMPDQKVGVAIAYNMLPFPSSTVAQGIFAILMGKDPEKLPSVVQAREIERKMKMLTGNYETYMGISKVKVVNKGGLLYLEQKTPFGESSVPLIPESEKMETYKFYTWSNGVKSPVEFVVHSPEKIDLYRGVMVFHKIK